MGLFASRSNSWLFNLAISSDQVPLQNMSVFAQIISYLISGFAAFYAAKTVQAFTLPFWVPVLGIGTACFILSITMHKLIMFGISFSYLSLFLVGIVAALWQNMRKNTI